MKTFHIYKKFLLIFFLNNMNNYNCIFCYVSICAFHIFVLSIKECLHYFLPLIYAMYCLLYIRLTVTILGDK